VTSHDSNYRGRLEVAYARPPKVKGKWPALGQIWPASNG
jgi:hypothetical protein